jgi:dipeptidyl aminopeptidase/acylaminoacyl peptidase
MPEKKPDGVAKRACQIVVAAGMIAAGLCGCAQAKDSRRDSRMLGDLAVSPDGRTVAFEFSGNDRRITGLGLYEWQTGKLTRVPNPPGRTLSDPSFSHDGRRLAVVTRDISHGESNVGILDLSTMSVKQVTKVHNLEIGDNTLRFSRKQETSCTWKVAFWCAAI